MKKIFIIISFLAALVTASAQMRESEAQLFRLSAYRQMLKYAKLVNMADKDEADEFMALFLTPDVWVYNDLIGIADGDNLTVQEYADAILKNTRAVYNNQSLMHLDMQPIQHEGEAYTMDITVSKNVRLCHKSGILLDQAKYFEGLPYDLTVHMVWNAEQKQARIDGITGNMECLKPRVGSDFIAIDSTNKMDERILTDGLPIPFDQMRYATEGDRTVARPYALFATKPMVYFPDPDYRAKLDSVDHNMFRLRYKPLHFRVRPFANMSLMDLYTVKPGNNKKVEHDKSSAKEFGLEFGFVPSLRPGRVKLAIMTGIGMSLSNIGLSISNGNFSYQTTEDIDRDSYRRIYEKVDGSIEYNFKDLVVPLYLEMDIKLMPSLSLFLDAGVKAYFPLSHEAQNANARYSTSGLYTQYDNLILGPGAGINNFTNKGVLKDDTAASDDWKCQSYSIDAMGRLGIRVLIAKPVFLDVSVGYQYGLTDYYKNSDADNARPLNYIYGKGEFLDLMTPLQSVRRQALVINAGLCIKF